MLNKPNDQPSSGYPVYSDPGPLPKAHINVSHVHLSDVAGPPSAPNRAPDAPMAGPTSRPAPGGTSGGPDQPAQSVPSSRPAPGGLNSGPNRPAQRV